jgi:lipopolysaccharide exporter
VTDTKPNETADDASQPGAQGAKSGSMFAGVAWMIAFRLVDRGAGVVSILVLARLLLPQHFGIVALASSVVAFVELIAALGLDTILIQKRDVGRREYDTAWTIQLLVALLCTAILVVAALPASWFFREPRLEAIVYAMGISVLIDGFHNIRIVEFRKNMRFDLEFRYLAARRLFGLVVTMTAAFILRNEWALAIGVICNRIIGVGLSYAMLPYRPRLTLAARQDLLVQSGWLLLANLVQFARSRSPDILLGRLLGPAAVGSYVIASDVTTAISSDLVAPINRVALPEFGNIADRKGVAQRFDQVTGQVAIFLTPLAFGLAVCADLVVQVLFGAQWASSAPAVQYLALAGWIAALGSNLGVALVSLGHYRANAIIHGIGVALLAAMLAVGALAGGIREVSIAVFVANFLTVVVAAFVAKQLIGYRPLGLILYTWRPTVAAGVMYAVVSITIGAMQMQTPDWPSVVRLAIAVGTGAVTYPLALGALWALSGLRDGAERTALAILAKVLARRPRAA